MVEAAVDTKAGFCSNCRRGDHTLCASPTCTCPDMRKHRNRPGFAGRDEMQSASGTTPMRPIVPQNPPVQLVKQDDDAPVWCDPPPSARGRNGQDWATLAAPCKERPGEWLRLRKWPGQSTAGGQRDKIKKALGAGWELRGAKLPDGSAVWVRWMGSDA